uniref:Uncharacterized protein n=1 Tax=Panagrolaimus sp. PS1159 TaxID=55785 RepID=A0AC35G4T1_9BILA
MGTRIDSKSPSMLLEPSMLPEVITLNDKKKESISNISEHEIEFEWKSELKLYSSENNVISKKQINQPLSSILHSALDAAKKKKQQNRRKRIIRKPRLSKEEVKNIFGKMDFEIKMKRECEKKSDNPEKCEKPEAAKIFQNTNEILTSQIRFSKAKANQRLKTLAISSSKKRKFLSKIFKF